MGSIGVTSNFAPSDAFGNALGESIAASGSSGTYRGEGTAASPYVNPDTGEHIVFGAASPQPDMGQLVDAFNRGDDGDRYAGIVVADARGKLPAPPTMSDITGPSLGAWTADSGAGTYEDPRTMREIRIPSTESPTNSTAAGTSGGPNSVAADADAIPSANDENEFDRMDDRFSSAKSIARSYAGTAGVRLGAAAQIYLEQRLQVAAAAGQPLNEENVLGIVNDVSARKGLLTPSQVQTIFPSLKGNQASLNTYTFAFNTHLPDYGIDTPERQAAFFGQVAQETGGLTALVENLNYPSAEKIASTFRRVFHGDAKAAEPYVRNPSALEAAVYPDGAGRGVLQITGASNLRSIGSKLGVDLLSNPDLLVTDKYLSVQAAAQYWADRNINVSADRWDLRAVTLKVNGAGLMGLNERTNLSNRYLNFIRSFQK
jgi:putative chitinase